MFAGSGSLHMTKTELQSTFALSSIFAFRMLGLFMILPIFSIYAEKLPYATPTLIGLALGVYGLTQALFQLPFGIWSDFTSRRKVISIGLMIFALGSLIAALNHTMLGIIVGRALQGAGAIGSTAIALVGDLTSEKDRTKSMAIIGISIGTSFIIAMIIGPILGEWVGLFGIFGLTAALALLGLFILWRYIPTPTRQHREFNLKALPEQLKTVLFNTQLFRLNSSILISHMILTASFLVLPPIIVSRYHLPLNAQWKLYLPIFLIAILLIGGIMRKMHALQKETKQWLICIFSVLTAQIFLLKLNLSFSFFCFALFLFFYGFTFLEALLPSMVSKVLPANYRGTATGVFSTCQFLGIFLGGSLGGLLLHKYQVFGIFLANSILALLWLLVMIPLWFRKL